jgi:uncharacterized protein
VSLNAAYKIFLKHSSLLLVGIYRSIGTTFFGGSCRFEPSCSDYAQQALSKHEPHQAIRLIGKRIINCRPGGSAGFDPVPEGRCQT